MPPKNAGTLAEALISLITDESLRQQMGDKGRLKAVEYDWEHIAQRVFNYYLSVLNGPRRKERSQKTEAILV